MDKRPNKRPYTVNLDVQITPFGLWSLYDWICEVWEEIGRENRKAVCSLVRRLGEYKALLQADWETGKKNMA